MKRTSRKVTKLKKKAYHIIIAIPSRNEWDASFGMSLAVLMSYAAQVKLMPDAASQHIVVNNVKGSILPQMRQQMVDHVLEEKASHILFMDSDMVFPRDTLHRLLGWNQLVVAANCCTKMFPTTTTARQKNDRTPGGTAVFSAGKTGLERVWRVGTGIMLIDARAFDKIDRPFFSLKWGGDRGADQYVGEDWALCERFEQVGVPIFIDHGLSQEIGHMGSYNYGHTSVVTEEEEEKVRQALAG
jgi:hypothetical protein